MPAARWAGSKGSLASSYRRRFARKADRAYARGAVDGQRVETGMRWYAYDVIMLVAYVGVLANCGAFLAFGWRFPGTFRRPEGARLRAWAGVCLGVAGIIVALTDAATAGFSDVSGARGNWLGGLLVLSCVLILAAFVLVGMAVRGSLQARRAGSESWQVDELHQGKHAASRHEPDTTDGINWPGSTRRIHPSSRRKPPSWSLTPPAPSPMGPGNLRSAKHRWGLGPRIPQHRRLGADPAGQRRHAGRDPVPGRLGRRPGLRLS